jgi:hypothetical protein
VFQVSAGVPPLARARRIFVALAWLPVAAILYGRWSLGQMEGFAASAAGGYLVLPGVILSAATFGAGVLLLALRRSYDPVSIGATLLAGAPVGYFLLWAFLR